MKRKTKSKSKGSKLTDIVKVKGVGCHVMNDKRIYQVIKQVGERYILKDQHGMSIMIGSQADIAIWQMVTEEPKT